MADLEHADASNSPSANSSLRAEKTALRLIARAEQCSAGLSRKLERRGFNNATINEVISKLTEKDLLNDSRFAKFWLQSKIRFARSPRRLLVSLNAKGIYQDVAQSALTAVLNEENAEITLIQRYVKKYTRKTAKSENPERFLKYMLKGEGFSASAIEQFLEQD